MCFECLHSPCNPRCPNAPNPEIIGYCDHCGEVMTCGDEIYTDICGNKYCSFDCACNYNGIRIWDYEY